MGSQAAGSGTSEVSAGQTVLSETPPDCREPRPRRPGAWNRIAAAADNVERIAKPLTYLLGALALLSIYFPGIRRTWDTIAMPYAWYQAGTIRMGAGNRLKMDSAYDAAAWNGGLRASDLFAMAGTEVLTGGTAVGRVSYRVRSEVVTVLDGRKCLRVHDVALGPWQPGPDGGAATIQSSAVLVSEMGEQFAKDPEAALRAMIAKPNCEPSSAPERASKQKSNLGAGSNADPGLPICPRINVWIKAQRVAC